MAKKQKAAPQGGLGGGSGIRDRIKELRRVRAGDLIPNPRNWRTHPQSQQDALRGILEEVGYAAALLARETPEGGLVLIDGHLRAETTPDEMVPVLVLDVDDAEANKLLLTFDPLSAMAGADNAKLDELLREIDTGSPALQEMLADLAKDSGLYEAPAPVEEDEVPPVPENPVTQLGDLWILGDHRLLCADSTNAESVGRVLDGRLPNLMVTDPPYGVEYKPTWRHDLGLNKSKRTGAVTNDDNADWTPAWRLFPGNVAYVWHAGIHSATVQESLHKAGLIVRGQIIWVKPRMVLSRGAYHWKHEPLFHAERLPEGATEVRDRECEEAWYVVRKGATASWDGGRKQTTVWEIGFSGEVSTSHGTQKPVECMARPMRNHCRKGDDVYDPFMGSGTTISACQQLGMRATGCELSPAYCDVIVLRWEKLTGMKAELAN